MYLWVGAGFEGSIDPDFLESGVDYVIVVSPFSTHVITITHYEYDIQTIHRRITDSDDLGAE